MTSFLEVPRDQTWVSHVSPFQWEERLVLAFPPKVSENGPGGRKQVADVKISSPNSYPIVCEPSIDHDELTRASFRLAVAAEA